VRKKVLICGATGFIGRNLIESLMNRDELELFGTYFNSEPLNYPGVQMAQADLTSNDDVNRVVKEMDLIIQAAATTSGAKDTVTKPYYHVTDNAVMNSLIFRAAHEHKVSHVVFFSCTTMYQSSDIPVRENDFNASQEIYPSYFGVGWTKVYIEKMCEFYSRLGNTKYTAIRHSNIYGPYDKFDLERSHVFGATMTKVMTAKDGGRIMVWGDGSEERDLLYVSDLVDFVESVIELQEEPFELINLGCGSSISIKHLAEKMIGISNRDIFIEFDMAKPTIKFNLVLNVEKARQKYNWRQRISLEEGIRKTLLWYKENISA